MKQDTLLRDLPKIELHRHLEGAIRLSTLLELGRRKNLDLPLDSEASLAPRVTWTKGEPRNLAYFLSKFRADWYSSYHDVERIFRESMEDAAAEGIIYMELRFSPEHFSRKSPLDPYAVMEAIAAVRDEAADYTHLEVNLLITLVRERYDEEFWKKLIDQAVRFSDQGVVGVDLAGNEQAYPNQHFDRIFHRVKDTGVLGITIHSGESEGAGQVESALDFLQADRIGHGVSAIGNPGLIERIIQKRVTLEMCPISNYQTGCVDRYDEHPLPALDRAGVRVTLNSDDPRIHGTSLLDDHDVAIEHWNYTKVDLFRLARNALNAAFCSNTQRHRLLKTLEPAFQTQATQAGTETGKP
jgi:adenosine deaminase